MRSFCKIGTTNARVFPDPVCAYINGSQLPSIRGIAAFCIGIREGNPSFFKALTSNGDILSVSHPS